MVGVTGRGGGGVNFWASENLSGRVHFEGYSPEWRVLSKLSVQPWMGFEPVTSADTGVMLYQLSYEATHWERGQFIEFISPVRSEVMWSTYEIIHIWTAVVDESEEWSSQLIFQFKQLERRSLKKIRASTGFEPVTSANTGAMLYQLMSYEATHCYEALKQFKAWVRNAK